MYPFEYHRPATVEEAVALLGALEDAKLLSGGQTLLPTMKSRLASPAHLVDLSGVATMKGVRLDGGDLVIGGGVTYAEIAGSDVVKEALPALSAFTGLIGDPAVRHCGTIGGSIANNDPAADYPAACLALGATIRTSARSLAAEEFFTGLFSTALADDELVVAVSFPTDVRFGYAKFRNPASRYAIVGVAVAARGGEVRVAVTGSGADGVFRWAEAEQALETRFSADALDGLAHPIEGLNSDMHAPADYRAHLIGVMARRAAMAAAGEGGRLRHEPLAPVIGQGRAKPG